MQAELKKLYNILSTDSALQTLIGGTTNDKKIYPEIANQFEAFPCITYAVVTSATRAIPRNTQDITVQFDIFSKTSKQEIEDIYSRCLTLLNYYKDTVNFNWIRQVAELDNKASVSSSTDRQLWIKSFRVQIWSKNN
jgi:hypothetical protein